MIRGSVGIGRRARLRILCSLRTCGFKSHLPHFLGIKRVYQKALKPRKINGFGAFLCLNLSHKKPSFLPHSAPFLPHRFFIISLLNLKLDRVVFQTKEIDTQVGGNNYTVTLNHKITNLLIGLVCYAKSYSYNYI